MPEVTYGLAMAAAQDAGNRSMREGRRTVWAVKDWYVACETFERLYPHNKHHEGEETRANSMPNVQH